MPRTFSIISVAHFKHFFIYEAGKLGTDEQRPREKYAVRLTSKPLLKKSLLCLAARARTRAVAVGEKGVYPI